MRRWDLLLISDLNSTKSPKSRWILHLNMKSHSHLYPVFLTHCFVESFFFFKAFSWQKGNIYFYILKCLWCSSFPSNLQAKWKNGLIGRYLHPMGHHIRIQVVCKLAFLYRVNKVCHSSLQQAPCMGKQVCGVTAKAKDFRFKRRADTCSYFLILHQRLIFPLYL